MAIHSEPPGAATFVDEVYCGYADVQTPLRDRFNPVSPINLVEPIGWVVDALTGAIAKFDNNVHVELAAKDAGATTAYRPVKGTPTRSVAAAFAASTHPKVVRANRR